MQDEKRGILTVVSKQECIKQYYKLIEKLEELHEIRKRVEKDFLITDTIKTMRYLYQDMDNVFPMIEQQLKNDFFNYDKLKKSFEIRADFVQRRIKYLKEMSDEESIISSYTLDMRIGQDVLEDLHFQRIYKRN